MGNFNKTESFLQKIFDYKFLHILEKYGREGVEALSSATPVDTGKTAASWDYEIRRSSSGASITWTNSNIVDGVPVAILIQYGHGTDYGTYVQGRDYINPALKPVFDRFAEEMWKEVVRL